MKDEYDPLTGELLPKSNVPIKTDTAALTEAQLQKLLSDPAELRNLAKSKLIEIVHGSKATIALVPAIKEILDRIDGKPAQAITMAGNLNVVTVNANVSFVPASRDNVIIDNVDNVKAIDNK